MQTFFKSALAIGAFLIPGIAGAQMTADPVSWSAAASKRSGKTYEIRISSSLKQGWHIYAIKPGGDGSLIPTSFEFTPVPGGARPGAVKAIGKPKAMDFPGVDGTAYVYEGKTDFTTTVSGAPGQALSVTVGYQSCNEQMCLPPKKKVLTIKLP
jgi:DsbC/DsbD-like thiol-disulfide interchange protein